MKGYKKGAQKVSKSFRRRKTQKYGLNRHKKLPEQ